MKIATNLEQGRKLTEILPIESADMYWWCASSNSGKRHYLEVMEGCDFVEEYGNVRAWSLAALLDIIPFSRLEKLLDSRHMIKWDCTSYPENHSPVIVTDYDDPIDACVDMIVTLHTLKLL